MPGFSLQKKAIKIQLFHTIKLTFLLLTYFKGREIFWKVVCFTDDIESIPSIISMFIYKFNCKTWEFIIVKILSLMCFTEETKKDQSTGAISNSTSITTIFLRRWI